MNLLDHDACLYPVPLAQPPPSPLLQAEEQRKNSAQQMVADGELSADVFAEDLEEIPDMETEFAEDFAADLAAADEEDDSVAMYEDAEDDSEQWVERIIELNRVTKVCAGSWLGLK